MGAYLKLRAAASVAGRLGLRAPGSVGRIAQTAARTQNRASEVVGSIIEHAPAAAKVVERAAPSLTTTLSRPLWEPLEAEGGAKAAPAKGDPLKLYKKRLEELDRALEDPEGTRQRIIDNIPAPPRIAQAIADREMAKLEYLKSQLPPDPRVATVRPREATANLVEVRRFAEVKRAVEEPVEAIKDVIDGRMSPRAAEAVRQVFPRLYQAMADELVEKLSESDLPIPFERLVRAALAFPDVPLSVNTRPEYGAERQAEYAQARQTPQTPSGGPKLRLSPQEELGPRRALR